VSDFYPVSGGFESATTEELNLIALERGGALQSIGYGYAVREHREYPPRPDGWSAKWINTRGMGNHGTLVLVGTTPLTRAIRREGTVRQWMRAGLTREQADRLYSTALPYRHELVETLVRVLADHWMTCAFLSHPGNYGSGSGRTEWCRAWAEVNGFGRETKGELSLSAPREAALAKMVKAVDGGA
jgi:hypothetical protein